ncbi:MAG TPA: hypothetical protein VNR40_05830 [Steroidobacter sp.]|nr:hypothetical protein [Steroidobacter sp.]
MDAQSLAQAQAWARGITAQVLDLTWRAFDRFQAEDLQKVDLQQNLEQLERDLTSSHFAHISQLWKQEDDGFSSVFPHHEFPEQESRPGGSGRPPAYDLAFVYTENRRIAWPIEAKVVHSTGELARYLSDVNKFINGKASPLTGDGGVIAYLLSGKETDLFAKLQDRLRQDLLLPIDGSPLSSRPHRISHHERNTAPLLQLHHMAMHCVVTSASVDYRGRRRKVRRSQYPVEQS